MKVKHLAIGLPFTANYAFAINTLVRKINMNLRAVNGRIEKVTVILSTDVDAKNEQVATDLRATLNCAVIHIQHADLKFEEAYKYDMQMSLAKMQGALFDAARNLGCDMFWSLESDVIPPTNALRCLIDALNFDDGYYDIAFATYPSQGGGSFLGGHGTPHAHIEQDHSEDERTLTEKFTTLKAELDVAQAVAVTNSEEAKAREGNLQRIGDEMREELKNCPPNGNVFALNAIKWRRRGWLDYAYPAIGKGAMLPTDWTGLGCTLLSKRALEVASFEGYEGKGTQDLFLTWYRFHPAGMRSTVLTHCPCSHVCRERDKDGKQDFKKLFILHSFHEEHGESRGHLRVAKRDFVDM